MERTLTLSLNPLVIEKAEEYANAHDTSLSKLVESYLVALANQNRQTKSRITPLVESLSGVIELPDDFDEKEVLDEHTMKKHT